MIQSFLKDLTIRGKLIGIVMISSALALLLVGIAFIAYDYSSSRADLFRSMATLTDVIGINCTASVQFDNSNDAKGTLASLLAERQVVSAGVYAPSGEIFASYPADDSLCSRVLKIDGSPTQITEDGFLVTTRSIKLDGEPIGFITVRADMSELSARLKRDILMIGLLIVLALLFAFFVVSRLQRVISEPVLHLTSVAKAVSKHKDYSIRAIPSGADEIGYLVGTFNEMLTQVQDRDRELLDARDFLEQRVRERTSELETEIAERVLAQEKITASLREKEVLLKEVHHRVKNNLQIVTSLLNLQAGKIKDKRLEAMFRDSQGRVKTMALIHEKLYRSENLSEVNFPDYVQSLTSYMMSTVSGNRERISVIQDIDELFLGVDTAIPCGLIINELVTNSLKYAFPNHDSGEIIIYCKKRADGRMSLVIGDNGVGIPGEIDIENTGTLGMQLVTSLIGQLDGTIRLEREGGLKYIMEFASERHEEKAKRYVVAGV